MAPRQVLLAKRSISDVRLLDAGEPLADAPADAVVMGHRGAAALLLADKRTLRTVSSGFSSITLAADPLLAVPAGATVDRMSLSSLVAVVALSDGSVHLTPFHGPSVAGWKRQAFAVGGARVLSVGAGAFHGVVCTAERLHALASKATEAEPALACFDGGPSGPWTMAPPSGTKFVHASAGSYQTVWALSNGDVFQCGHRGKETFSRLRGTTTTYVKTPVQIGNFGKVQQIEAGGDDVAVLLADGKVHCWGDDVASKSEISTGWTRHYTIKPRHIAELDDKDVVSVALSDHHKAAALTRSGELYVWYVQLSDVSWKKHLLSPVLAAKGVSSFAHLGSRFALMTKK